MIWLHPWIFAATLLLLIFPAIGKAGEPRAKTPQPPMKTPPGLPRLNEKILDDPQASEAAAAILEAVYQGKPQPENVRMLVSILRGARMGAGDGWFGPSQTRYTWSWLAAGHGINPAKETISRKAFRGTEADFARLDRDRDGVLSADDFDWSGTSPVTKASQQAKALFDSIDNGDGKVATGRVAQTDEKALRRPRLSDPG